MDFVYSLPNLIRTPCDLFNVLYYVSMVVMGFLLALYIGNSEEFNNYIYNPYLSHIHISIRAYILVFQLYVLVLKLFGPKGLQWTPIGNSMLYISNLYKKIFEKWFK